MNYTILMKMYLSSFRLGDQTQELVKMVGINKKVAVIANAMDFVDDIERRKASAQREIDALKELGFQPEEVDLRNDLVKLSEFGMIWVRGGNVFTLRKAYKLSGFDQWLIAQKDNDKLVYAGYSAGVCVLSPSLRGLELVDDPGMDTIWDGLGLIDFAFAPHYQSDHPESEAINKVVEYYKTNNIPYKALRDGEVIILNKCTIG
jgi:dipeptidase E